MLSSATEAFPLDVQEAEENFDLALIGALEIDVVPHLGDKRIPDPLVGQLAKVLHQGSRLYEVDLDSAPHSPGSSSGSREFEKIDMDGQYDNGSTKSGALLPRERFSYWCFDLLFLICSDTTKGGVTSLLPSRFPLKCNSDQEPSRRRLAALSLPSLLSRCRTVMVGYVADAALRGNLPFPRAREDELLYVLRKLLELRLWPGSLWAALSEEPSTHAVVQPGTSSYSLLSCPSLTIFAAIDATLSPSLLIADAVKRSSVAHLFHFYPVLCEIASIPRKTPSSWVLSRAADALGSDEAMELDARVLARECLKEVGREMGVRR
jgi:hypothetical protein